jgi:hypothetical protein
VRTLGIRKPRVAAPQRFCHLARGQVTSAKTAVGAEPTANIGLLVIPRQPDPSGVFIAATCHALFSRKPAWRLALANFMLVRAKAWHDSCVFLPSREAAKCRPACVAGTVTASTLPSANGAALSPRDMWRRGLLAHRTARLY